MGDRRAWLAIPAAGWIVLDALLIRLAWGDGTLAGMEWAVLHLPAPAVAWGVLVLPATALILVSLAAGRWRTIALWASAVLASTLVGIGAWLVTLGHDSGAAIAILGTATAVFSGIAVRRITRARWPR